MNQQYDDSQIDSICDSFETEWAAGKSPSLEKWLTSAEPAVREKLLPELVRVDLEYRLRAGDSELFLLDYVKGFGLDPEEISVLKSCTFPAADSPTQIGPSVVSRTEGTPRSIGGHSLLKEIGRGGMGVVYLARNNKLGRLVAFEDGPRASPV